MKKSLVIIFLLLICQLHGQTDKHVIVVTLDGLRLDFYLSKEWDTPNLKALVRKGAFAEGVISVFPSMTFPAHTTMITGVTPEKHGVYYNNRFKPDESGAGIYWNFKQINSPTIWETAKKGGLKVASLVWPVSAEAPVDFNIPDIGGMGNTVLEKYSVPKGITSILKREVLDKAEKIDISNDIDVAKIAAWVIKNEKPNLMTIHMFGLDHAEHRHGREGAGVQKALSKADFSLGIILNAIKEAGIEDRTLFIVLGDHGFFDRTKTLNPNVLLAEVGLLRDIDTEDWDARFHTVGGAAFLYVKNNDKEIVARVEGILKGLSPNERIYFRIVNAEEMKRVGADPNAAFAISACNQASFGGGLNEPFVRPGSGGTHGHFPDTEFIQTGFIAAGAAVKPNTNLKMIHLYDLVPIISHYLNLKLENGQKGKVPENLFKEW